MSKFKALFPLSLILVIAMVGSSYWFNQKQQIDHFAQQISSIAISKNKVVDPKDLISMERDRITLQNTLNSSVLQFISGSLFFITAYIAWLNLIASEKKQIAERFAKAVDQIGNDKLEVRVGGIFALEQIALSSPEDHWTVMEVLTSFIRDQSLKGKSVFKPDSQIQEDLDTLEIAKLKTMEQAAIKVTADIQAALTVICRRNTNQDPKGRIIDLSHCDLRGANLKNANLSNSDLRYTQISNKSDLKNANLSNANLQGIDLTSSFLNGANLYKSNLNNAVIKYANLQNADLQDTDLTNVEFHHSNFRDAKLNRAKLYFTNFAEAQLQGANLKEAKLKLTNLRGAGIDAHTKIEEKWRRVHEINIDACKDKKLDGFDFSEAVLSCANFEGASLKKANFNGADLGSAKFKGANLEGASFCKTDIMLMPNLDMADFGESNLEGAIFIEASLQCTNFMGLTRKTNLSNVTFQQVNLASAIFQMVILKKAKFINSFLQETDFSDADITEGTFDNCYYIERSIFAQTDLNKAVFIGHLGSADFRNSKHQNANFQNADKSAAQF
jgi:uncharacterized protein YjbI with pentapeptide repeats